MPNMAFSFKDVYPNMAFMTTTDSTIPEKDDQDAFVDENVRNRHGIDEQKHKSIFASMFIVLAIIILLSAVR